MLSTVRDRRPRWCQRMLAGVLMLAVALSPAMSFAFSIPVGSFSKVVFHSHDRHHDDEQSEHHHHDHSSSSFSLAGFLGSIVDAHFSWIHSGPHSDDEEHDHGIHMHQEASYASSLMPVTGWSIRDPNLIGSYYSTLDRLLLGKPPEPPFRPPIRPVLV